jgi:hypothetical protein
VRNHIVRVDGNGSGSHLKVSFGACDFKPSAYMRVSIEVLSKLHVNIHRN